MNQLDNILFQVGKPARYTGGEWNSIVKDWDKTAIKFALSYPDLYDIGMSNMAIPILYEILNNMPDVLAERVYAPWKDMENAMRAAGLPLYALESKRPLKDFDIIGFSLGYELCYTNVLNMLDLAQDTGPGRRKERLSSLHYRRRQQHSEPGADGGLYRSLRSGRWGRGPG